MSFTSPETLFFAPRLALPRLGERARMTVGIVAFTALTAVAAQIRFSIPWTPVPVTGQTFAVLLAGAALGLRAGALSQLLYVVVGALGAPVFTDAQGGWHAATGSTAGYLAGFVLAAAVVGGLAERRQDRNLLTSVSAMLTGTAVVYACGAAWLAHRLDVGAAKAVELGVAPFLIGDSLKLLLAAGLLPAAWRLVRR